MSVRDLTPWTWGHKAPAPGSEDPFRMLQERMDWMFNQMFGGPEWAPAGRGPAGGMLAPRIDVTEEEKDYLFTAELPGVTEKDVEVTLIDGTLTIKGEKKSEMADKKDEKGNVLRTERSYGSFQRSFSLPADIDEDQVSATFDKGVLTVKVAKSKEAKARARKVEIKAG